MSTHMSIRSCAHLYVVGSMHASMYDAVCRFTATLTSKNGVPTMAYRFAIMQTSTKTGNYKTEMVSKC